MNRKNPEEKYKEYSTLSKEQKQNIQIEICKKLDEINKIMADNPILAYNMQEDINELFSMMKNIDNLCKMFDRFLRP